MSHQSAQHHHLSLNSVPQAPQKQSHQPNLTAPIKSENDSDDDVASLPTVPKILHSPDEYDPECQCSTCKLATKLLAECTCEQCGGTGQPGQSSKNVPIANAVSPTNGQPSSSSIQNNDVSTSEHTNANDLDDDHSRSSTPDYLPRFFDHESGDSSLDDSENDDSVDDGDDSSDNMEVDKESLNSNVHSKPSTSCQNAIVTNVDKSNLIDNGSTNSDNEGTDHGSTQDKCPKCAKTFLDNDKLLIHYRGVHQEWKPYYCRWPNCNFTSAINHIAVSHADRAHFKAQNRQKAKTFVGKRQEDPPKDHVLEQIVAIKLDREKKSIYSLCITCGRNLASRHMNRHIRTHAYPGFRCTWPNCGFFYSIINEAKKHICSDHLQLETANSTQTNQYLVKMNPKTNKTTKVTSQLRSQREEDHDNTGDEKDYNLDNDDADNSSIKPTSTLNFNCPKCNRNFRAKGQFTQHFCTHANSGFRCTKCGAFYSHSSLARKHLLMEHFKGKHVNATQINELVIKVDPNKPKSNELHDSIQNNDASTSEHTNANDQHDDDRSKSSTPDYLPRLFDDESGDMSSDDNEEDDDSVDDGDKMELVQESEREADNDNNDPDYAFNDSSSDDSEDEADSVDDGDDSCDNMEVDNESESYNSNVHSKPSTSCQNANVTNVDKSNLIENGSINSDDEGTDKCPKCAKTFTLRKRLLRHYRGVHQEWKPYYCQWPKCDFTSALDDRVITHADRTHFNLQNRQIAKRFVGKREEAPPKDPALKQIDGFKFRKKGFFGQARSSCPRCGRNFYSEHLKSHIRTHARPGYRCTWPNCTFFFFPITDVKKHVRVDHLQVEQANSTQTNQYLVKVNPKTGKTTKVASRLRRQRKEDNSDNSENEEDSSSDDNGDENGDDEDYKELDKESEEDNDNSDQDYAFSDSSLHDSDDDSVDNMEVDDESESLDSIVYSQPSTSYQNSSETNENKSNSNDNKSTNSVNESTTPTPTKCPKCAKTFSEICKLLRHYRGVHQEWKPYYCRWPKCNFTSAEYDRVIGHADRTHFNSQNRQKVRKCVGKREETPPHDPVLENIGIKLDNVKTRFGQTRSSCPRCGRSFYSEHIKSHIRTHENPGYSCTWPNCGFFFSQRIEAKKHFCSDHLRVEKTNLQQTKRYFLRRTHGFAKQ